MRRFCINSRCPFLFILHPYRSSAVSPASSLACQSEAVQVDRHVIHGIVLYLDFMLTVAKGGSSASDAPGMPISECFHIERPQTAPVDIDVACSCNAQRSSIAKEEPIVPGRVGINGEGNGSAHLLKVVNEPKPVIVTVIGIRSDADTKGELGLICSFVDAVE